MFERKSIYPLGFVEWRWHCDESVVRNARAIASAQHKLLGRSGIDWHERGSTVTISVMRPPVAWRGISGEVDETTPVTEELILWAFGEDPSLLMSKTLLSQRDRLRHTRRVMASYPICVLYVEICADTLTFSCPSGVRFVREDMRRIDWARLAHALMSAGISAYRVRTILRELGGAGVQ